MNVASNHCQLVQQELNNYFHTSDIVTASLSANTYSKQPTNPT